MNNPLMNQIAQSVYASMQNPQLMQNKNFSNAVNMFNSHKSSELHQFAENACKEFGITYEEAMHKLGIN